MLPFEKVKHLNNDKDCRNIILFSKKYLILTEFFKTIFKKYPIRVLPN